MNLIILTIDALRKDILKCYNQEDGLSIGFSDFYDKGIILDRMYTSIPDTYPALGTLFTGLYPFNHHIGLAKFDKSKCTLFDYLLETHQSLIFTEEPPLGESLTYQEYKKYGLDDVEASRRALRNKPANIDKVINFISANQNRDFFLTMHLDNLRTYRVKKPQDFSEYIRNDKLEEVWQATLNLAEEVGKIIERIYQILLNLDILKKTIVVIIGDHGDYLAASRKFKHFHSLKYGIASQPGLTHTELRFEPIVNVPCILYHPELKSRRISSFISFIDIMPTLLDFLDIKLKDKIDGESRKNELENELINFKSKEIYIDQSTTGGIFTLISEDGYKLLLYKEKDSIDIHLYNILKDPTEDIDLTNDVEKVKEMMEKLKKYPINLHIEKKDIIFRYSNYENIAYVKKIFDNFNIDDWKEKADVFNQLHWANEKKILNKIEMICRKEEKKSKIRSALDVGVGTGIISEFMKNNFKNLEKIVCIDKSPSMLSKMSESDIFQKKICDASSLPILNNTFDLVLMRDVLPFLKDPNKVFSEIYRVLKNNGVFILCEEFSQNEAFFDTWYKINLSRNMFERNLYKRNEVAAIARNNFFLIEDEIEIVLDNYSLDNYLLIYEKLEARAMKRCYYDAKEYEYKNLINYHEENDIRSGQPYGDIFIDLKFVTYTLKK